MFSDGPGFAQELTQGIRENGALTSLNLAHNNLRAEGAKHIAEAVRVNVSPALRAFSVRSDVRVLAVGVGEIEHQRQQYTGR